MSDIKFIESSSRFVVPFFFNNSKDGYEKIRQHFENYVGKDKAILNSGKWVEGSYLTDDADKSGDSSLYSYILDVVTKEPYYSNGAANLGTHFLYSAASGRASEQINELGVFVFKNGVGFIWYEIDKNEENAKKDASIFLEQQKNLRRVSDNEFGRFVSTILDIDQLEIEFGSRNRVCENGSSLDIPHNSLSFNMLSLDAVGDATIKRYAYRLANGLSEKYEVSGMEAKQFFEPYEKSSIYVSNVGFSFVESVKDGSRDGDRTTNLYEMFYIYILLLFQSYSCVHYMQELAKLPASAKEYDANEELLQRLEIHEMDIDLFLVKGIFELISNDETENEMYKYGKRMLKVDEESKNLTERLGALKELVREKQLKRKNEEEEKRSHKLNGALYIFGFLTAISALIDAVSFAKWVDDKTISAVTLNEWIALLIVVGISGVLIWSLVKNYYKK